MMSKSNTKKSKPQPVVLDEDQLEKLGRMAADLPGLMEYAHNAGGFQIIPTKEGAIKTAALRAVEQQANIQMQQIMDQMKLLASQAQKIKDRVDVSQKIYQAKMGFKPVIGNTYYLYRRQNGEIFLSVIEPGSWSKDRIKELVPIAEVQLLADQTWEVLESFESF